MALPPSQPGRTEADRQVQLAFARHKSGDIESACRVYRQVLSRFPEHAAALHYLGLAAQQRGDAGAAIDLLRRSIASDPSDARAWNHLGQVLIARERLAEALECFERAVTVDPQHVDSLVSLANVCKTQGGVDRSISLYRRALELSPRSVIALYNLANTLKELGASDEALELYRHAVAIEPRHYQARYNLGVLLEQQGRFEEAVTQYLAVRGIRPSHCNALAGLLANRTRRADEESVKEAEERVRGARISDQERIRLHNSLGKYYDRQARYDTAFDHFAAAKAIVRRSAPPFSAQAHAERIDRLIATFSPQYFASIANRGSGSERPVFVVGMPRSGTTLTEQILASHPAVNGAGELPDIPLVVGGLGVSYPECLARASAEEIAALADRYLAALEKHSAPAAARVVDKLPTNFMHLGFIATLFPNAHIVHCRRDPLDVGLSCFIELFQMDGDFTTDLETFAEYYLQYERLMVHWRTVLPTSMHEQRYEDLVTDPQTQIRALIERCGLDWDEVCLEFHETQRTVRTPSRWQVRQPIYQRSAGRWQNYAAQLEPLRKALERSQSKR